MFPPFNRDRYLRGFRDSVLRCISTGGRGLSALPASVEGEESLLIYLVKGGLRRNDGEKIRNICLSELCAERAKGLTCCALIRRQGKRRERGSVMDRETGEGGAKRSSRFFRATFKQFSSTRPYTTCCAVNLMKNSAECRRGCDLRANGISCQTCEERLQECLLGGPYSLTRGPEVP